MFCPKCGTRIDIPKGFCPKCGAKLPVAQPAQEVQQRQAQQQSQPAPAPQPQQVQQPQRAPQQQVPQQAQQATQQPAVQQNQWQQPAQVSREASQYSRAQYAQGQQVHPQGAPVTQPRGYAQTAAQNATRPQGTGASQGSSYTKFNAPNVQRPVQPTQTVSRRGSAHLGRSSATATFSMVLYVIAAVFWVAVILASLGPATSSIGASMGGLDVVLGSLIFIAIAAVPLLMCLLSALSLMHAIRHPFMGDDAKRAWFWGWVAFACNAAALFLCLAFAKAGMAGMLMALSTASSSFTIASIIGTAASAICLLMLCYARPATMVSSTKGASA